MYTKNCQTGVVISNLADSLKTFYIHIMATPVQILPKFAFILASVSVALGALEIGCGIYYYFSKSQTNSEALPPNFDKNTYVDSFNKKDCVYRDYLYPHPYLGWVLKHHAHPCPSMAVNNMGFRGSDYPLEREPGVFVIMLAGGSVADQQFSENMMEQELNAHYTSGHIRRFVVLSGAEGAWKQPQQFIAFALSASVLDGIITLDGFNEHYALRKDEPTRLEAPANNFIESLDVNFDWRRNLAAMVEGSLRRYEQQSFWIQHSNLAFFCLSRVRALLRSYILPRGTDGHEQTPTYSENPYLFPQSFPNERRPAFNQALYLQYTSMIDWIADKMKIRSLHFIQPVPGLSKTLTDEEIKAAGPIEYREVYLRMEQSMLNLNKRGLKVVSLTGIFKDHPETLYVDWIHFNKKGRELLNRAMVKVIADQWGFERHEAKQ
jgi:hypothetical protein